MATLGLDCEIILDGTGYFIKPESYSMKQPRLRKASVRADGGEAYIDLGPGRRQWSLIILCLNDLLKYDGTPTALSGQQYRDALRTSYTVSSLGSTINFSDPLNSSAVAVHFDNYQEVIRDLHSQIISAATGGAAGATYEVHIQLIEA
jgi:hypothetical protein